MKNSAEILILVFYSTGKQNTHDNIKPMKTEATGSLQELIDMDK